MKRAVARAVIVIFVGFAALMVFCHQPIPRPAAGDSVKPGPVDDDACRALGGVPDTTFPGFCRDTTP